MPSDSPYSKKRRRTRHDIPGQARLLTFSCYRRRPLIQHLDAWDLVTDGIDRARSNHGFNILAYVIMPDHVHLMILPRHEEPSVSGILSTIKQSASKRATANRLPMHPEARSLMADIQPDGRSSIRLWQRGGGHDRNLFNPATIWDAVEYIHANPVRRGLSQTSMAWRWSSAAAYALGLAEPLSVDLESMPIITNHR